MCASLKSLKMKKAHVKNLHRGGSAFCGKEEKMPTDPVCGMEVKHSQAQETYIYKGKILYFCSKTCQEEFEQSPQDFIEEKEEEY